MGPRQPCTQHGSQVDAGGTLIYLGGPLSAPTKLSMSSNLIVPCVYDMQIPATAAAAALGRIFPFYAALGLVFSLYSALGRIPPFHSAQRPFRGPAYPRSDAGPAAPAAAALARGVQV